MSRLGICVRSYNKPVAYSTSNFGPHTATGGVTVTDAMTSTSYVMSSAVPDTAVVGDVTGTTSDLKSTDSDCGQDGKIDLVLLLDASGSVGSADFRKQVNFLADLVAQFDVGPTKMQVAAATYDSDVNRQFYLNDYNDTQSVVEAIRRISYTGGSTATHLALNFTRQVLFADGNGHRKGVPKVVIIATDGDSDIRSETESESLKLKQEGVRVYPIAIGSGVSLSELTYMATDPSFVFKVDSFNRLQDFLPLLQKSLCTELRISVDDSSSRSRNATFSTDVPSTSLRDLKPTDSDCGQDGKIDLALLLDASGSVNYEDFIKQADFLADLVAQFDVGPAKMQVAAATFDSYVH
ncbi:collagen alpha-5(VI) chain, partial [Elysia marginata]